MVSESTANASALAAWIVPLSAHEYRRGLWGLVVQLLVALTVNSMTL